MKKYIKTTLVFAGIWFCAALVNGLLSGVSIILLETDSNANPGTLGLAIIFSFVFSAPVVGFIWLITVIAQVTNKKGNELFRFVLNAAFFTACTVAIIFINTLGTEFMKARYAAACCIVVSALAATLIFRNQIKSYE